MVAPPTGDGRRLPSATVTRIRFVSFTIIAEGSTQMQPMRLKHETTCIGSDRKAAEERVKRGEDRTPDIDKIRWLVPCRTIPFILPLFWAMPSLEHSFPFPSNLFLPKSSF
ncbi:hypothetical protein ANCCAN_03282 [Ancylostoma caninum]|uniref:Uncharacterized protein n=1 Tax=Ancylostoma caninum TaxID=29170 RepID=A0A368H4V3_ANCCA|nr:hypothetical protein ANCCAN_03282 [Ancylostoma caninum]